jgi:hypothetical protein
MKLRIASGLVVTGTTIVMCLGGCPQPSSREADEERLVLMRAEIMDLIAQGTCSANSDCGVRAIGVAPCGGPSEYLAYAPATVDEAALATKIYQYNEFADYMIDHYGISGACILPTVPMVTCQGGRCVAETPAGPVID